MLTVPAAVFVDGFGWEVEDTHHATYSCKQRDAFQPVVGSVRCQNEKCEHARKKRQGDFDFAPMLFGVLNQVQKPSVEFQLW